MFATACIDEDFGGGSDTSETKNAQAQEPKKAKKSKAPRCPQPEARTRSQLPAFPPADNVGVITQNPCVSVASLADEVVGFIPEGRSEEFRSFRGGLEQFVGRVNAINDAAECAYETDHLSIGAYHHVDTPWSIGVVAVVRGDLDALIDTGVCWLLRRLPLDMPTGTVPDEMRPDFCADAVMRTIEGERYTILWVGSSNVMCGSLATYYSQAA
ncbi:hypothetical protein [Planotetraspora kaengkrachanensis]|uniref:Uncharacterized protein n=1 Tax=Planotetraspora kaengkrachanensis TaxID=575193 RepID=A0A8J3LSI3_9ACTN|nr:hypothetical protein [Planotetraspora kaengkrachanensis]GIG77317.1 hypothetical protein Pka01_04440 [Planotetraspora kaengkrachanensis]